MSLDNPGTMESNVDLCFERLAAPPIAPMAMPKQVLERTGEPLEAFRRLRERLIGRLLASEGR